MNWEKAGAVNQLGDSNAKGSVLQAAKGGLLNRIQAELASEHAISKHGP